MLGHNSDINVALEELFAPKKISFECKECKKKVNGTKTFRFNRGPQILALSMNGGGFEMKILENYHLVGVVCQNEEGFYYSMAKRGRKWYLFKPHVIAITEEDVMDLAHGTKMLFYKRKE